MEAAEAPYRAAVMANTWGHLAPDQDKLYRGSILFAQGAYRDLVVIQCGFPGLPDSPWFYQHLQDFIDEQETESGCLYAFRGTYSMDKDGNAHWKGKTKRVLLSY